MMDRIILFFLLLLLIGCSATNAAQPTAVQTATAMENEQPEELPMVYDIISESGIGNEMFQRPADGWAREIVLRFHLKGLEEMRLQFGDTAVTLSIASSGQQEIWQSVSQNGQNQTLQPGDPNWMQVVILNDDSTPGSIPLENGTINVLLPASFYEADPESFTLSWIDFYR